MHSSIVNKYLTNTGLIKLSVPFTIGISLLLTSQVAFTQTALEIDSVQPMGRWLSFEETNITSKPVSVHLRTGYERAVIMPEPVTAHAQNLPLHRTKVVVEKRIVGFYPEANFSAKLIKFVGVHSGSVYELSVESSTNGNRQPLKINR